MDRFLDESWKFILGPGSMHDRLRRDPRIDVDPHIFHASLLYDEFGRDFVASLVREYADIAQEQPSSFHAPLPGITWKC